MVRNFSAWTLPACVLVALQLVYGYGALAQSSASTTLECPARNVRAIADDPHDAQDACVGAEAVLSFFASLGLLPRRRLVVEIVSELPEGAGPTAVGSYLQQTGRILVLPYSRFRRHRTWFNVSIERELYRSLAAHEVAHAVAADNFAAPRAPIQVQEYVAYVAMFEAMNPALRHRILAAMPDDGFEGEDRITEVFFLFDPMRFGVKSYRHYLKEGNGAAFLRAALAGKVLVD